MLLNISSSPYYKGRGQQREEMVRQRARQYKAHIAYVNLVGGQDELVFDGHSLVVSPTGQILKRGNAFAEEVIFADIEVQPKPKKIIKKKSVAESIKSYRVTLPADKKKSELLEQSVADWDEAGEVFHALVLGTRDYIRKNKFGKVIIGLSGGIDSALTAVVAVEALGAENVIGVLMPSPHSSTGSVQDSQKLAANLGILTLVLPVEKAMAAYDTILNDIFKDTPSGTAEENLQARIRGNLLMAISNKLGWLVLTTGNKSEISVGYCTLYGDMAGGFAVIKDVPKTWVYQICQWLNGWGNFIPQEIIDKEPSAELRPDQKDTDSLPPYDKLDAVLMRYIEEDKELTDLKGLGLSASEIKRVVGMVDANEYKRRQGPPGIKITPKAFGKDRRLPITNRYVP